jgi:hypothetical protein
MYLYANIHSIPSVEVLAALTWVQHIHLTSATMNDDELDDEFDEILLICILYYRIQIRNNRLSWRNELARSLQRARSSKIRRGALHHPEQSAWMTLFNSGFDDALITTTGFDHRSFENLHRLFEPYYKIYSPYNRDDCTIRKVIPKKGRKRLLDSRAALALALVWTRTRGANFILQMLFGITNSPLSLWLRFSRRIITKVLLRQQQAKVVLPTKAEIDEYSATIQSQYPLLKGVWGAMDGLKIHIECSAQEDKQNMFYNGWQHDHYVTNIFCFAPDGKIRASFINAPGCLHDSMLATWANLYTKFDALYDQHGGRVVVDSAFSRYKGRALIKSYQSNYDLGGNRRQKHALNRQATSLRQMSEWGMRGLQASFPRLKDRLKWEETGERKIIIQMIVLLYNYRVHEVGQNQIKSVFYPHLERNANQYF